MRTDAPVRNGLPAMHPGELLCEDVLPALGRTRAEIARLLGVSRQTLHAILTERAPVTAEMALRLGKLCGNGPEFWLALQTRYDLERLRETKRVEIDAIPTLAVDSGLSLWFDPARAARSPALGSARCCLLGTGPAGVCQGRLSSYGADHSVSHQ